MCNKSGSENRRGSEGLRRSRKRRTERCIIPIPIAKDAFPPETSLREPSFVDALVPPGWLTVMCVPCHGKLGAGRGGRHS